MATHKSCNSSTHAIPLAESCFQRMKFVRKMYNATERGRTHGHNMRSMREGASGLMVNYSPCNIMCVVVYRLVDFLIPPSSGHPHLFSTNLGLFSNLEVCRPTGKGHSFVPKCGFFCPGVPY